MTRSTGNKFDILLLLLLLSITNQLRCSCELQLSMCCKDVCFCKQHTECVANSSPAAVQLHCKLYSCNAATGQRSRHIYLKNWTVSVAATEKEREREEEEEEEANGIDNNLSCG